MAALLRKVSRFHVWLALLAAVTVLGFFAIVTGFVEGHEMTFNTSTGVPWGILIPAYLFFVIPASGLCLLSSLGHIFGMKRFEPLSRRAIFLAIVLLLSGFLVIASDMERPWRMILYVLITPNPTSAIWWMGTLYGIYFMVLIVEFTSMCRVEAIRKRLASSGPLPMVYRILAVGARSGASLQQSVRLSRFCGTAGVILAIAALSTLGAVFGFTGSRSLWQGALLPIYFVLSALLAGSAALALSAVLTYSAGKRGVPDEIKEAVISLGKLLLLFLGIFLLFTVWSLLTAQYNRIPAEFESVMLLIKGPLAVLFWVGEILLGILAPVFILIYTRTQKVWGIALASLLVIVSMFAARYDFIIAGQLVPVIGRETLWQYAPSLIETLTVVGAFSLFLLLYSLGNRLLPLGDSAMISEPGEEEEVPQLTQTYVASNI